MTELGGLTVHFANGAQQHVDHAEIGPDAVLKTVTDRSWVDPTFGPGQAESITRYYSPHSWQSLELDTTGDGTLWVDEKLDPNQPDAWHPLAAEVSEETAVAEAIEFMQNRFNSYRNAFLPALQNGSLSESVTIHIPRPPG